MARGRTARGSRAAVALLLLVAPACTIGVRREETPRASRTPAAPVSVPPCRTTYAAPDPDRPRITLTFDVDPSYARVTGTERVVFTPDAPVRDVVFRLWANGPGPVAHGGRIEVTSASLPMAFEQAGAGRGTQGTLLRLALPAESPAGKAITVDLAFTLTLPRAEVDRWGHTAQTAWWASAHPMLAWVRGRGWDTTPAVGILGETAANETARYDVTVVAPFGDTVFGIAIPDEPVATAEGKRRWRFVNDVARDVAVTVGRFTTRTREVGGVPARFAVSDELATGTRAERILDDVVTDTVRSMETFTRLFGSYPYESLTVVALDSIRGAGVEYPAFFWVGSRRYDVVVPHELAHLWFYGLVGNDQGDHPWLDESFASYAEGLVNRASGDEFVATASAGGAVGRPMSHWDEDEENYGRLVYAKGGGMLLVSRAEVGAAAFDKMLRCYVNKNAHRVATPEDVRTAFAPAPVVVDILRDAGALP
ncbi:MAG TPA: M1 family aminopeptidase [Frankiaceae bacterium]|nr:M1 family aminopeptidase [Frankiaceae bacterium]